jgi:hypothetical protein
VPSPNPYKSRLFKPQVDPHSIALQQMRDDIAGFSHDPFGFVMYVFPWGVENTSLAKHKGPRKWQRDFLIKIGRRLRETAGVNLHDVIQEATASGHGIGKSALVAWLILWAISTREMTKGMVTANTADQLRSKTWAEVRKWHSLAINQSWFECTATKLFFRGRDVNGNTLEDQWKIDCVTWSEHNTEAFQGLHNEGQRILIIFDEASKIPAKVFEVAEGATTDPNTEVIWCVFGNPTRPSGPFRDCFGRMSHRWGTQQIDARTVEDAANAKVHARMIEDYGLESDRVKVRILGQFPSGAAHQLIPDEWIYSAIHVYSGDGSIGRRIFTADIADGGEDESVITEAMEYATHVHVLRQRKYNFPASESPIKVAQTLLRMWEGNSCKPPDTMIVDRMGVGAGTVGYIIDSKKPVIGYAGGEASANPKKWRNRRVQSYINLRDALRDKRISFAPDFLTENAMDLESSRLALDEFVEQMTSVELNPNGEKVEDLITKEQMLRDGVPSPDRADSVAMLFASQVPRILAGENTTPMQQFMINQHNYFSDYVDITR